MWSYVREVVDIGGNEWTNANVRSLCDSVHSLTVVLEDKCTRNDAKERERERERERHTHNASVPGLRVSDKSYRL